MTTIEQAALITEFKVGRFTHFVKPTYRENKTYQDPAYKGNIKEGKGRNLALLGVMDLADNNRSSLESFRKHWLKQQNR